MIDPVSDLLERRSAKPWRWRSAIMLALVLHVGVVAAALIGSPPKGRALTLPRVQVRIAAATTLQPPASVTAPEPSREVAAPKAAPPPAKQAPKPHAEKPKSPARKSTSRTVKPAPTSRPTVVAAGAANGSSVPDSARAKVASPAGGIGLGGGTSGTDEAFPYAYYLNRVLATIEGNWFRPPVAPEVHCRVLCRIDRSGSLVQVGIEEPSGVPAFDRAALRSVYASAPFPPLPQGYGGTTLTLHLEFGSK